MRSWRARLIDLGSVSSLRCLSGLTELEEVLIYGSTNVRDGDLGWLANLPKVKNLSFQNRRHYTHKREEFDPY